jgi:hypothetical protein
LKGVWRCTGQFGREPRGNFIPHYFNCVGFLLSLPKNGAHDPIKLHIGNGLVRILAGWSESCLIHATGEKTPA